MNEEKILEFVMKTSSEIAQAMTKIEHIAIQLDNVVGQIGVMQKSMAERFEAGQKSQGERIGEIEKLAPVVVRLEKKVLDHEARLDKIDAAPAEKWNKLTWLVVSVAVTAVVAFLVGKVL